MGSDWLLALEFYPEPGFVYVGLVNQWPTFICEKKKLGAPASHPLQLYLKAHYLNKRVTRAASPRPETFQLDFGDDGLSLTFEAAAGGSLRLACEVPGRKPYRQELKLAMWPTADESSPASEAPAVDSASVASVTPAERKREKLLANIRGDVRQAEAWLERFGAICRRLSEEPSLWKRPEGWLPVERELLDAEIRSGHLPPFADERHATASAALDRLFRLRRRAERKLEGGQERLRRVQAKRIDHERSAGGNLRSPQSGGPAAAPTGPAVPRKKPGLWVELRENLWARLGRSATENDELFRQSRDRDLWFHVRGGAGAHVWIPRGQPGLGAKSDAPEDILRLGCQLALINSKSAKSGSAVVDFTERRGLRKIRGAVGAVEILRSQTRLVRLDEAFEKKIMRGGEG